MELIVRGNSWFTIGNNGAEFNQIKKGDIVFNHKQTEEIFKNGYVTSNGGRGRIANANGNAYKNGTAYVNGTWGGGNWNIHTGGSNRNPIYPSGNPIYPSYTKPGNVINRAPVERAKETKNEFKETVDFIEILIDRLERKINELDTIASSAYRSWSKRNEALAEEFSKVTEQIDVQKKAYDLYMQKANSIGLSQDYKDKIMNGELRIEDITDETLHENIEEFQDWYEKALDAKDAIVDLEEALGDLLDQNFENITNMFDSMIEKIEHSTNMLEGQLEIIENSGKFAGDAYFSELIKSQEETLTKLQEKYIELQNARNEAVWSGNISKDSEAYSEMTAEIDSVAEAWQEAKNQILEYKNEMWEMQDASFEWAQEHISDLTEESDFIRELLAVNENDLFDKNTGELNEKGLTSGSLHAMDYNVYMAQADAYAKKIKEIDAELAKDPNNTILLERKQEFVDAQRESILAANDEKNAIKDLIEESYDRMLDVLEELIDKRKEELDVMKDTYDYQNEIEEKTKNITSLRKQLLALEGNDNTEETQSRVQQLKDQLSEAEKDLEETEFDKYIQDQEKLLDELFDGAEMMLNDRLDNIDGLLQSMIDYANMNSESVNDTITNATNNVGYTMTEGMSSIWNNTDSGVGKILSMYNENFSNTLTTTNNYIKGIFDIMRQSIKEEVEITKPNDTPVTKPPKPQTPPPPPPAPAPKPVGVGSTIRVSSSTPIFSNAYGDVGPWGTHQYFANDPRYVIVAEKNGYYLVRHVTQSAAAGWFRKGDVTALNTGGYTGNNEGLAMLHKKERVLSARQTEAFENLIYGLLPQMANSLSTGGYNTAKNVANRNITIGDVHFELPNVTDPNSFMREMQKNRKFEKFIQDITLGQISGKGKLTKNNIKF